MLAIIGGSGLTQLANLDITRRQVVRTPYGEPSAPLTFGTLGGKPVVFLARHGHGHTVPPHKVNYRANIWALKHAAEADRVISVASVGAIRNDLPPGTLIVPHQIVAVHDALIHLLVSCESAGLAQELVDEGGLAVVNVGNDGDVAKGA